MATATGLAAADSRQLQKGRRKKLLSAGARSLASSVNKLASKQADNPVSYTHLTLPTTIRV